MRVWISGSLVEIFLGAVVASGCTAAGAEPSTAAATSAKVDPKADQLLRKMSASLRLATVSSQARGLSGAPEAGHCTAASTSASCTASSQLSSPP